MKLLTDDSGKRRCYIDNSVLRINAGILSFNMLEINNRRFMYNPETCTLILGRQYGKSNKIESSHAEEHFLAGASEPFDSFVRGWIGTSTEYTQGVIHFSPPAQEKCIEAFDRVFSTLDMFRENGALDDTVIRGFGSPWEQPLKNIFCQGEKAVNVTQPEQSGKPDTNTIKLDDSVMLIDAAKQSFSILDAERRRFLYNPETCTLVLGFQNGKKHSIEPTHAEAYSLSGTSEPFESFVRGWIVAGNQCKQGGIHFAPSVDEKNEAQYVDAYNTLQMFRENGAGANTIVWGFGDVREQPLSDILPGCTGQAGHNEKEEPITRFFGVWATRSAASVAGHAEAWLKDNEIPKVFSSKEAAEQEAGRCNADFATANTHYYARGMEPDVAANALKEQAIADDMTVNKRVYHYSAADARPRGELLEYRVSNRLNRDCALDIDATIRGRPDGNRLPDNLAAAMVEKYGWERIKVVLANSIHQKDDDGRFSQDNKEWAKDFSRKEKGEQFCADAHPALLDGFISQVRQYERESVPVYFHSIEHAIRHAEVDVYNQSKALNVACAQAIDKAINDNNYELYHYNLKTAAKTVIAEFGFERVNVVLAGRIQNSHGDGRYSRENHEWANRFTVLRGGFISSHPTIVDGFVDEVRKAHVHALAQVVGEYEKSHRVADRNRLTSHHSDTGVFIPNKNVTHERLDARHSEIMEKIAVRKPSAKRTLEAAKQAVKPRDSEKRPPKSEPEL